MDSHQPPFQWLDFPGGRARFAGSQRGIMDETGHETFAIEMAGKVYFGELIRALLPTGNDYNIEIVSFGYISRGDIGMPMLGACTALTERQLREVKSLARQLVAAGHQFEDRPFLLVEFPDSRFIGEVLFRTGWALVSRPADADGATRS